MYPRLYCSACCNTKFYTRITQGWSVWGPIEAQHFDSWPILYHQIVYTSMYIYLHSEFVELVSRWGCRRLWDLLGTEQSAMSPGHRGEMYSYDKFFMDIFLQQNEYSWKCCKTKQCINDTVHWLDWQYIHIMTGSDIRVITFAHFYCFPTDSHRRRAGFEVC